MTQTTAEPTAAEPKAAKAEAEQSTLRLPLPPELIERACPFDPPVALEEMREQTPVRQVRMLDNTVVWMVTGYAEARLVLSDPRFSADRFTGLASRMDIPQETKDRLLDKRARAGSFLFMDPPEHTRYRRLLTGQFTVRRMRQLAPRVEQIVTEHLDAMLASGTTADLVPAFALPVPSLVICELLGVPYADRAEFQQRTADLLRLDASVEETLQVSDELREFMLKLVAEKRRNPQDDLLSGLICQPGDDAPLDDDELAGISLLLLVAGHETTANMIGLGTFALLEHPEQLAALRADPTLIDSAVEEMLRHLSIVHLGVSRVTTEEVQLGDELVPAGATVMLSLPATNRDPAHWSDPASLDVARERSPHLAFGHGVHQCLGQQLARVEMTIAFTQLLRRLPNLRLAVPAAEVPLRGDMAIYGVHALPIAWDEPKDTR